jgi:uncharacterized protein (DUF736 family)
MPAIGYVTRQEDGSFKGQLRTLSIRADIEIVPNRTKNTENQPDYRIVTNSIEVGAAWRRTSRDTGASYVSLSLAAPEFCPRKHGSVSTKRAYSSYQTGGPLEEARPTATRRAQFLPNGRLALKRPEPAAETAMISYQADRVTYSYSLRLRSSEERLA